MAAKIIGHVAQIKNSVQVQSEDGELAPIVIGSELFEGDLLITGADSEVTIAFIAGHQLEVGSDAKVLLDETVYSIDPLPVEQLQQTLPDTQSLDQEFDSDSKFSDQDTSASSSSTSASTSNTKSTPSTDSQFERVGTEGQVDSQGKSIFERTGEQGDVDTRNKVTYERTGEQGDVDTRSSVIFERTGELGGVDTQGSSFEFDPQPTGTPQVTPPFIDPAVSAKVSITGPSTVVEGATTTNYTVSVDQSASSVKNAITVALTYSGTAADGVDFTGVANVIIAAGNNSVTFNLATIDDASVEGTENFTITIGAITDANFDSIQANSSANSVTTSITDNDQAIDFSIASTASISEDTSQVSTFTITLDTAVNVGNTATVDIALSGTATDATDFSSAFLTAVSTAATATTGVSYAGGTLSFDSTYVVSTPFSFSLTATNDSIADSGETIIGTLSNSTVTSGTTSISTTSTTTTITDIDQVVDFAIASTASINEDASESTTFTVTLDKTVNAGNTATVDIALSGTATDGTDFSAAFLTAVSTAAGTTTGVSYSAGKLSFDSTYVIGTPFSFSMTATNDAIADSGETIIGTLSNGTITNGSTTISTTSSTTTINDTDAVVTYAINSTASISEDSAETATFTITLGGGALTGTNTSSVVITPTGTGTSGTDYANFLTAVSNAAGSTAGVSYNAGSQTLTFSSAFNSNSGTGNFAFTMAATNDQTVEGTETIIGTLSSAAIVNGSASITTASTTTNITEVDAVVTYAINSTASISEDSAETATFTITLGGGALTGTNTSSVVITPTGTGTSGTDYANFLTSVSNAAGSTAGVSYNAGSQTLTFSSAFNSNSGTGNFAFTMAAINDQTVEGTETIIGTLSSAAIVNGSASITTAATTTNITELDQVVDFAIASTASINEDASESTTFTVTLDKTVNAGNTATVDIALSGTATDGTDFSAAFLTAVSTAAGSTTGVSYSAGTLSFDSTYVIGTPFSFSMTATNDAIADSGETIIGTLSNGTITNGSTTISTTSSTTTINDTDAVVTYAINSTASISEDSAETATFTITLGGGALTGTNTSSVVITPTGTGTSGTDYANFLTAVSNAAGSTAGVSYNAGSQTLTFSSAFNSNSGTGNFAFTMAATNDQTVEGTETIIGTLSSAAIVNGSASITTASTTTNITEVDAVVTYAINSTASISEDSAETATFTITLGGGALTGTNTSSVVITPTGTGTSGTDYANFLTSVSNAAGSTAGVSYNAGSQTLTFSSAFNSNSGTGNFAFTMVATNDQTVEGTETIIGTLSSAAIVNGSASITTAATTTNITELDQVVDFAIASTASINEDASESTTFTVTLDKTVNAGNTATVDIALSGTATDGTDFSAAFLTAVSTAAGTTTGVSYSSGTLSFDSTYVIGTPFSFSMTATNDAIADSGETIIGTLSNGTITNGSTTISTTSSTTTINDIDAVVTYAINSTASISEDSAETATFTITLGGGALTGTNTSSVVITPTGTGTSGTDYANFLTSVSNAAGSTAGVSYNAGSQTLTFSSAFNSNSGTGNFAFTMAAINDQTVEGTETIIGTLSSAAIVNGSASITTAATTTNITELDQVVDFAIASTASINEDASESTTFTVTLDKTVNAGNTATVDIALSGTATDGTDFSAAFLSAVSTAAGSTTGVSYSAGTLSFDSTYVIGTPFSFSMTATNDAIADSGETIIGTLSNGTITNGSTTISTTSSTTTINDIDAVVTYAINSTASISEDSAETATFTITLGGGALTGTNTSSVVITPTGTGTSGTDYANFLTSVSNAAGSTAGVSYNAGSQTLTFSSAFNSNSGTGNFAFTMAATNDQTVEGTETIIGTLSSAAIVNGSASITTASTTTNITELDQVVDFAIASTASINEDASESTTFTVTLDKTVNAGNTATVDIALSGTATDGTDFSAAFLTAVSTAAGSTTGVSYSAGKLSFDSTYVIGTPFSFSMTATNDAIADSGETIIGTLSNGTITNGSTTISTTSSTTTINDIDAVVTYAINSTASISEDSAETATFTITLGGGALTGTNTSSVVITPTGTGTSGTDYANFLTSVSNAAGSTAGVSYNAGSQTLTFSSAFNSNSGTGNFAFTMAAINDQTVEGTETIIGTLSSAAIVNGSASITTAATTTNITELDQVVDFAIASTASINEDASESTTFTVTLDKTVNAGNTATVDIALSGTATDGTDFSAAFLTAVSTAAGSTTGVSYSAGTLSFDSTYVIGTPFSFSMTATNDTLVDSGETIIGTLSNGTITNGSITLSTASSTTTITDADKVSFSIASTATITEEGGETATFTLTMGGASLAGSNTATIDINPSGTATNTTDYNEFYAAIDAGLVAGVTRSGSTLTFTSAFNGGTGTGSITFSITAVNDILADSGETIIATLSNPSALATIATASTTTTINDSDVYLDLDTSDNNDTSNTVNYQTVFTKGGAGITIADTDANLVTTNPIDHLTFTVAGVVDGADEKFIIDGTTYSLNANSAVADTAGGKYQVTVTGTGTTFTITKAGGADLSEAEVESLLQSDMTYRNIAASPTLGARTVAIVATDNAGTPIDSNSTTATITIGKELSVSDPAAIDEGKSAVFMIDLSATRTVATVLDLTVGGDVTAVTDYNTALYYKDIAANGTWTWTLATGNQVTIAVGETRVEVKVTTVKDAVADNAESMTLTAAINGYAETDMGNTSDVGTTTVNDFPTLQVSAPNYVSEGKDAIFEVNLSSAKATNTVVNLSIGGEVVAADYNATYQYSTDDGTTWTNVVGNQITITGHATVIQSVLVKVTTIDDGTAETDEKMTLTATTADTAIANPNTNVSDYTVVVDKLLLSVTEQKDGTAIIGTTTVDTPADATYTYSILGQGGNGTVTLVSGNLRYTPETDFSGTDTFTFTKTNNTTGTTTTSEAVVTVTAVADTPTISMSLTNKSLLSVASANLIANGDFETNAFADGATDLAAGNTDLTSWMIVDTTDALTTAGDTEIYITDPDNGSNTALLQTITVADTSKDHTITFDYKTFDSNTLSSGKVEWGYLTTAGDASTWTFVATLGTFSGAASSFSGTITAAQVAGLGNTIRIEGVDADGNGANSEGMIIDNVVIKAPNTETYTYNVNITAAISDAVNNTTEYEFLQDTYTISGVPLGAVFKNAAGTAIGTNTTNNATGTDTWSFTKAQVDDLKITVDKAFSTTSPGFTLTATTTSEEKVGASTASKSVSLTIFDSNDMPSIGDNTLIMANESGFTGSVTDTVDTHFSADGPNTFSWDKDASTLPEIYSEGQLVTYTFDDATGVLTGTIPDGAGTKTVFTVTINMQDNNLTDITYTQPNDLLGVKETFDGGVVLPGGGNADIIFLGFNDSGGNLSTVNATIVAHNLIEDTAAEIASAAAEHTVNTNNYYIGVDSNNMNPGDQLIMDFGTVATDGNGNTTTANEIVEMEISLFNFGSDKSGDELYVTLYTGTPAAPVKETIVLVGDSSIQNQIYTLVAPSGQAYHKIEFLAGNESSFKLGINSITQINYNTDFDMKLAYDITDADGDTDSGLVTISLDGDESIIYDSARTAIDAGAEQAASNTGDDSLVFNTGDNIDFSLTTNPIISNFEILDLTNDANTGSAGAHSLTNIKLSDVIAMTDSDNTLLIKGDAADSVSVLTEGGNTWTKGLTETIDSKTYDLYTNSGDASVTLKVENNIVDTII